MYIPNIFLIVFLLMAFFLSIVCIFFIKQLRFLRKQLTTFEKKETLSVNKKSENPLGNFFSTNTKSISIAVKKDGKISMVSNSLLDLLGYSKKQLIGKDIYGTLLAPISSKEPLEMNLIKRIFQNPKLYTEHETEFLAQNGQKVWISWTNRLIEDKNGKPVELRSIGFDITERKKLEEELQFIASKDPQTGALNRLALLENGTRELKRSIRYKHPFSVLALRLLPADKTLTSLQVESLLKQVVSLSRHTIRDVDYLGRIGEAEFILLLPETEEKNIQFLQDRLEKKIFEYNKKNPKLPIQVSFGSSAYTPKTKSIDELVSKAILNIKKRKVK